MRAEQTGIASVWIADNAEQLSELQNLTEDIARQNALYTDIVEGDHITHAPFKQAVADHLASAQEHSFRTLVELEPSVTFEELGRKSLEAERALGEKSTQLSALREQSLVVETSVLEEEGYITTKIPELTDDIHKVTTKLIEDIQSPELANLVAEREALAQEQGELDKAILAYGAAWPLPRLLGSTAVKLEDYFVDTFPVEKPDSTPGKVQNGSTTRNYPEIVIRTASEELAALFASKPLEAHTYTDLGDELYGKDEESGSSRVSALISNYELGKVNILGDVLKSKGLVLQRGERHYFAASTGLPVGPRSVIFRAVSEDQSHISGQEIHRSDGIGMVDHNWQTVEPKPTNADNETDDNSAAVIVSNNELPEPTQTIEVRATPITTVSTGEIRPTHDVPPQSSKESTQPDPEWLMQLKADALEVLSKLEYDGLVLDQRLSWTILQAKCSSRIMGTQEMIDRALKNKIISRGQRGKDSEITLAQVVCAALQNTHSNTFSIRKRRAQAISAITEQVKWYQDAKQKSNRAERQKALAIMTYNI